MTLGTQEGAGSFTRTAMRVNVAAWVLSGSINAAFGAELSKEYTECLNSTTTNIQWGNALSRNSTSKKIINRDLEGNICCNEEATRARRSNTIGCAACLG
jgi:hypothetical protein